MKDFINYTLSSLALLMSMSALIFTVLFQRMERKRNMRQMLTAHLNDIAKVNVDAERSRNEENSEDPQMLATRKTYNLQRDILMAYVDFLVRQNSRIMTSIDCSLMASTYDAVGNRDKADYYWRECIAKADTEQSRHINTREYASFLFMGNLTEAGRREFKKALEIRAGRTDDELAMRIDTYLAWAGLEYAFDQQEAFNALIEQAYGICRHIRHRQKRGNMQVRIDTLAKKVKETNGKKGKA